MLWRYVVLTAIALVGSTLASGTDYEPPTFEITPANQSKWGVGIWVRAGVTTCLASADVWVSIPETHDDVPFRSATLQIGLQDDPNHFHSNLRLETIAPEAVVVGGIEDHPAKAPKGFRGVVFCIGDASLKKARLTLDFYDSESPASRRLRLNIADLSRWLR
jgi:hypothetical protein